MKIRDVKEYRDFLTNGLPIKTLGSPDDPLLKELVGTIESLNSYVGPITKFATKTGTQIFYELLQNADDASASNAFFYFDEENFVVINNGSPFYTDRHANGSGEAQRKGQLKSFLAKGDKYSDKSSIGRYGKGSKLLYDLLTPVHHDANVIGNTKEDALIKAIIHEVKGPLLFSWKHLEDLEQLLEWQDNPVIYGSCTDDLLPLLTKVVYTYYPAILGEKAFLLTQNNIELFKKEELSKCVSFLNGIRQKINLLDYRSGTMLYIQLGEGQGQQLHQASKSNLLSGISTSLAFLKTLKSVQVLDEEVKKTAFRLSALSEIQGEDKSFTVTLGLPKNPKELDLYNFYQYFPVTDTTYGLKFVIQSDAYEIGVDRQRVDFENPRNKDVLKKISESIIDYIQELRDQEKQAKLVELIRCVVSTDIKKSQKEPLVEKLLYKDLIEALKSAIPTTDGIVDEPESAKIKKTALTVSPADFGFEDWKWLDENLNDYYDEVSDRLGIEPYSMFDLLNNCEDRDKLAAWMLNLTPVAYQQMLAEIEEQITYHKLKQLPIVRMSNGKTYLLEEIDDETDLLFLTPELAALKPILQKNNLKYGGLELFQSSAIRQVVEKQNKYNSHDYLKRFSAAINSLHLSRNEKWNVFLVFKNIPGAKEVLRSEMLLFENRAEEKKTMDLLIKNASELAPSGLLDAYAIKASEIYDNEMDEWLMQKENIWGQLIEDWNEEPPYEAVMFKQAVKDLQAIYGLSESKEVLSADYPWIWTDEAGWISSNDLYYNKKLQGLLEDQYLKLCTAVQQFTDLRTVPFSYLPVLGNAEFADLSNTGLKTLSEHWIHDVPQSITRDQLLLLQDSKIPLEAFFHHFIITSGQGHAQFFIQKNPSKGKQYFSADRLLNQFLTGTGEYFLLPRELHQNFQTDTSLYKESEEFAQTLINKYGAERAFVDMIAGHGDDVKLNFLNRLDQISFSSGPEPRRYKDEFEGKVIGFIVQRNWEDKFRAKIFIDDIPLEQFSYSDEVAVKMNNNDLEKEWKKFSLSVLNPIFEGKSDVLSKVKAKLEGISKHGNLFKISMYKLSELENDILKQARLLNPDQLSFLMSYYQSENGRPFYDEKKLIQRDFTALSQPDVLQNFFEKGITFFNSYPLPDQSFDLSKYIDTQERNLLLQEEYLPDWINLWRNDGKTDEKNQFLKVAGLQGSEGPVFKFRSNIIDDEFPGSDCIKELATDEYFAKNTFEWLAEQLSTTLDRDSAVSRAIHYLSTQYCREHKVLPDYFLSFVTESEVIKHKLIEIDQDKQQRHYLNYSIDKEKGELSVWAKVFESDNQIFIDASPRSYNDDFWGKLSDKGFSKCKLEKEVKPGNEDNIKEWESELYQRWKKEEADQYQIFLSPNEIPFDYYLVSEDSRVRIGHYHIGKVDIHTENGINKLFLHREKNENVLKILGDHQDVLFKDDAAKLVKLLTMSLEEKTAAPVEVEVTSRPGQTGSEIYPAGSSEAPAYGEKGGYLFDRKLEDEEYERLRNNLDDVKKLLENADAMLLQAIIDHLDLIKGALEKREKKITPNSLVGLIGERLVVLTLQVNHPEARIEYVAYEVNEYDIEFQNGHFNRKIDVKSTIKSIREEGDTIPFFMKRSQYNYIRHNPNENYYITRLSLIDLGLEVIYNRYKDKLGQEIETEKLIEQIDDELSRYISDPLFMQRFKQNRMSIKMNIPKIDEDFLEE